MRICLFTPYFLPGIGGVELSLHYLALHLAKQGHQVSILTATKQNTRSGALSPYGYRVYTWHKFPFPLIQKESERHEKNLLLNLSLHWAQKPFDILNAHFAYPTGYAAAVWGQNRQAAVVITSQGVDVQMIPQLDCYGYRYNEEMGEKIRLAFSLADSATGMSRQIVKDTIEAGCPESRAILVPNGIALEELQESSKPPFDFPYILSLGRLDHIKGVDLLLKSFHKVYQHNRFIKLVVTGFGPAIHSLVDQALSLGIGDRVIFTGTKTGYDKIALLQHCRFFVCASRTESLGNANIEALACGKPVIAYRAGGIPDVIQHGVNGFLVTPYHTSEFADRILHLLQNPDLALRMGERGKKIARDYDWPIITRRYLETYRMAMKNKIRNQDPTGRSDNLRSIT